MQKLPGSPELVETESVLEKRSVVVEKRDLQEKSTTCLSNEKKSVKMIMENMMKSSSSSSRGERTWMVEVNDEVVYSFSVQDESICMDKVREQVLRGLGENAKVPDGFAIRTGLNKVTPVESDDTLREVIAGLPNFTVIVPVYTAETTQAQQQLEDEAELVSKVAAFDLDEEMSSSSCSDDEDEEDEIANDDDDDDADDDDDEDCENQEENGVDASEIEFEDERAKSIIAALAERDSSVNVEETLAKFESIFPDSATKVGFLLFASNQKEKRLAKIGLDVAAAKKVSRDEALAFEYEILAKLSPTEVAIALLNYRIKPGKLLKSGLGRLGYTMKLAKKAFKGGPYGVKAHKKMMKKAHKAHKKMKGGKHMRPDHPWAHGPGGHHGHHHGRHGLGGGFRGGRHGGFGGHVPFEGPEGAPRHGGPHHGGPHHGGPHHGGPHHGGPHHGGPHHGGPHHGGPHHGGPRHGGPHHGGRMHFGGGPLGMMGHPGCPPPPPFEHQHSEARMPVDSEVHGGPAAGFGGWAPHMGRGGRGGRGRAGFGGRGGHMFHPGFMAGPFAPPSPKNHNGESSSDDEGDNEKFSGAGHFGLPGHWGGMMWHGGHHGHHGRGPRHAHHGGLGFGGGPGRCHMRGMRNHPGCMKKLARFVAHKSIPDGMKIRGLTTFEKKWRIRNDSEVAWAGPASLVNARGGDNLSMKDTKSTLVGPLQPGEEIEVEIGPLQAPEKPGLYKAFFRLQGDDGRFGQRLWCEIFVPESNEDVLAIATEEAKEQ